jgi:cytochrome c oxidase accessory protein FixG
MRQSRISPQRQSVQWLSSLLLLLVPFLRVGGESLLRLDAPSRTLYFFGSAIRIEEFYLFLLITLIFVFIFLFITMVFGRVWCGWFCPQTTVTDLAEAFGRRIERLFGTNRVVAVAGRNFFAALISLLVASNLIWYFIPPAEYFARIMTGSLGLVAGVSLVSVVTVVWADLVFIRRYFCTAICPYGRMQLMAMDANTLTLEFDPAEAHRCIACRACERVCPTGIDIKQGFQVECINCGRCIDACRSVLNRLEQPGIIHYSFGRRIDGGGKPVNLRSALLGSVIIVISVLLTFAIAHRSEATIKVRRGGDGTVRRMPDGAVVNFYTAYLENRSRSPAVYDIMAGELKGHRLELLGPTQRITVAANENRRVDFMVKVSPAPAVPEKLELRLLREGTPVAEAKMTLLVR